jgi:hypothetical protein
MFFLSEHGFAKRFLSSEAHLQGKWSKYRETAPFQFVRVYASSLKWTFDHSEATFLPTLTRAANDVLRLRLFFARSLWIKEQLKRTLDPRALKGADLFRFPKELAPSPCGIPPADASMYAHLDAYSRDRSGL